MTAIRSIWVQCDGHGCHGDRSDLVRWAHCGVYWSKPQVFTSEQQISHLALHLIHFSSQLTSQTYLFF